MLHKVKYAVTIMNNKDKLKAQIVMRSSLR
jgi:hypothetical protein